MKIYQFFLLFLLLNFPGLSKGQYYRGDQGVLLGINAGYFYPTGDMGKMESEEIFQSNICSMMSWASDLKADIILLNPN